MPISLTNTSGTGGITLLNNSNSGNINLSVTSSTSPITVWVWGDSNVNTFTASLRSGLISASYTPTITATRLSTTYNGNEITGSNPPDVLIMWTNGGDTGGSGLSNNIRTYVNNGGGFVTYVFMPSIRPTGWDTTLTPVQTGTQGNTNLPSMSQVNSSTILNGVDLRLNNAGSTTYFYITLNSPFTQSGATVTATWPSLNQPAVVERVSGSNQARSVYINFWPVGSISNPTGSRLLATRAALWAAKKI